MLVSFSYSIKSSGILKFNVHLVLIIKIDCYYLFSHFMPIAQFISLKLITTVFSYKTYNQVFPYILHA